MPCDSIVINRIALNKMDPGLLDKTLKALGWKVTGEYRGVKSIRTKDGINFQLHPDHIDVREGYETVADQLKQAYSGEVVKDAAEKNGWEWETATEEEYENAWG